MENWINFYSSLSEDLLKAIALLRVIECTNGCIQHAFRDGAPDALTVEQTRTAMTYSMAAMKNLEFTVGSTTYKFSGEVANKLKEARELYIRAFKKNEDGAIEEFFDCSIACAKAIGIDRIREAMKIVKENLSETFPPHTVEWGANYLANLTRDKK